MTPLSSDWRSLAEQASMEMDPGKLLILLVQLDHVLAERQEALRLDQRDADTN